MPYPIGATVVGACRSIAPYTTSAPSAYLYVYVVVWILASTIIARNDFYFKLLVTGRFWDGANALERFRDLANAKSGEFYIIKHFSFLSFVCFTAVR